MQTQNKAIDLSHHLSDLSRARKESPLKGLAKYFGKPGLIVLAGGMPHPDYFPFSELGAELLVPDSFPLQAASDSSSSWFWKLFGSATKEKTTHASVPKYPVKSNPVNLAQALQYGTARGLVPLNEFIKEFSAKVYQPAYDDFEVLVHTGNTDGWNKVVMTLCNPGEGILTEDWTYPSALASAQPLGMKPVPITMDGEGMRPDCLRKVLAEWNPMARGGMKRPHVMYTVPIGQNPSGATMGGERKQQIYDICCEFDVIIVEDDPYYFLQEGVYKPKKEREAARKLKSTGSTEEDYVASLAPSYLKFDTQGRVIRMDTFSKTVAPGSRLGWFTCSPLFAERLERQGETSTQAPCGFGQSIITELLITWKYDGYIRWLRGLGEQYTARRDHFVDCMADEFDLQLSSHHQGVPAWEGCDVYTAYDKIISTRGEMTEKQVFGRKQYLSFVPPTSGMFVWVKVNFKAHPRFNDEPEETLEMKLWVALAEGGILISPGWFFFADKENDPSESKGEGHYRISFSNATFDDMKKAVQVMHKVMREFFQG